ncbi:MAG: DEAD/DEAH box helicase [Rudaea sp.]
MPQQPLTDIFFDSLELQPSLLSGLHAAGFTRCTPIQALALPVALQGRDVAGQAQTGTGKTAAFLVTIAQRLLTRPAFNERGPADPRALVIAPTRELAIQIDKDFHSLCAGTGLTSALIYGGVDYDKQRQQLRDGVDIVIATPGRLLDYFKQHVFAFSAVEIMVIDEADRMFDLGFIKDVRYILRRLPERDRRQCLLFSATLSHRVLELAYEHMNEAEKLTVDTENITADRVRQVVYFPSTEEKLPLLIHLLSRIDTHRSMVFVNMKVAAEKVARRLQRQGFRVGMLSGDVPQKKRQSLLARFQRGEIEILIATDVAARGLHIPDVSHVFNYDLPQDAEDYVHRIGRTARLGAEGDAISFACDMYAQGLPDIEAYIEQKIPVERVTPELLEIPPPRESTTPLSDDEVIVSAPPRPRSGSSRTGSPRTASPRSGSSQRPPRRESSPRHPPRQASASTAAVVAAPVATAETDAASGARKRKSRGGRGRRRGGDGAQSAAANPSDTQGLPIRATSDMAVAKRQKSVQRSRAGMDRTANPASAGHGTEAPAAKQKKPGFFRRLGRMFKRS